jgi:hypothetical protein
MFGRDNQHAVGARYFIFEAHDLRWQIAFVVLVIHRQIVDARESTVEFAGAEPDQRLGELAIDGIAAIAADNQGDARQLRRTEHG